MTDDVIHITEIDGNKAAHAIITKTCRANRGALEAFDEAARRLRERYAEIVGRERNANANFHLVLTLDRWGDGLAISAVNGSGSTP